MIAGHYWSGALAELMSSALLDVISEPNCPLDVIQAVCAGLGLHYSGMGEQPYLKAELSRRHNHLLSITKIKDSLISLNLLIT